MTEPKLRLRIRSLLLVFVIGLTVSGLTAVPLTTEIVILKHLVGAGTWAAGPFPGLAAWIGAVYRGVTATARDYPFMLYGTDWLAFGHVALAIAFIGPLRDPLRNRWVIECGLIICALVIPWAFIFGPLRGIPLFWSLIDCTFGVLGFVPLWLARKYTLQLDA